MVDIKKKYIILGAVAVLAISFLSFTSAKISQAKNLFSKLKFSFAGVGKVGIAPPAGIWLDIDLVISNPTAEDFYISSGGAIVPKVLTIYNKNELFGFASIDNLYSLEIKSGGRAYLKNIRVNLDTFSVGSAFFDLYQKYGTANLKGYTDILKNMIFEIDIEAFGQTFTLKQSFS